MVIVTVHIKISVKGLINFVGVLSYQLESLFGQYFQSHLTSVNQTVCTWNPLIFSRSILIEFFRLPFLRFPCHSTNYRCQLNIYCIHLYQLKGFHHWDLGYSLKYSFFMIWFILFLNLFPTLQKSSKNSLYGESCTTNLH